MTILIFAGTTEGRELAERLSGEGIDVEVCVATEYGEQVLQGDLGLKVHQGRLSCEEMRELYQKGDYAAVIDATHPYATVVSENIIASLEGLELPYFRLEREKTATPAGVSLQSFASAEECAEALLELGDAGKIFLTTGSKELESFCREESLKKRLVIRVLPGRESMELCWRLGLEGKQIIAMQGPFTKEMNLATIRQYEISCLVTKESGKNGGEDEKILAAAEAGIPCMMIRRPQERTGKETYSGEELFDKIMELAGGNRLDIVLAGMGMGDAGSMTVELKKRLEETDDLFGAPRLLEGLTARHEKYPYYLAKDILPHLRKLQNRGGTCARRKVTILFSGDSGFYSGCEKLLIELRKLEKTKIRVLPGISSVSALSARLGIGWQDAEILSAHGQAWEEWSARVLLACKKGKKVFLLTSGPEDIRRLGALMAGQGLEQCRLLCGYQLSYPEERILSLSPKECDEVKEAGLYTVVIVPGGGIRPDQPRLTPGRRDEEFLRGQVPMTKEEIRMISICKLGLWDGAVVCDIGSGTGSVAMEMASLAGGIQVYALECDPEAVSLIKKNKEFFGAENIHVREGMAPEALEGLPAPTHAFIGGSKGRMKEILDALYEKNPGMRIVVNVVTLEGIAQMQELLKNYCIEGLDIVTVSVSRAKKAGAYHLMMANNPVTIFSFSFRKAI